MKVERRVERWCGSGDDGGGDDDVVVVMMVMVEVVW